MFTPDLHKVLEEDDQREAEIPRILASLKKIASVSLYKRQERIYARELADIARRRPMIQAWLGKYPNSG